MGRTGDILRRLSRESPILIAGPTASGKSSLALEIADRTGATIVNADALQVYGDWRVLTAGPSVEDTARAPHALYGHVPGDCAYSVGAWLRDVAPLVERTQIVIVGGTGLYFSALTEGLADIPETPPEVRIEADARLLQEGAPALLGELDATTAARIDQSNPVRIQRAWEVLTATGRGLADWQDDTGPALLPRAKTEAIVLNAPPDWLNPRIEARVAAMLAGGALEEARANRPDWSSARRSAKAIGAAELMAHLDNRLDLDTVAQRMITLTRQYAKRQRSWFRARMGDWIWHDAH